MAKQNCITWAAFVNSQATTHQTVASRKHKTLLTWKPSHHSIQSPYISLVQNIQIWQNPAHKVIMVVNQFGFHNNLRWTKTTHKVRRSSCFRIYESAAVSEIFQSLLCNTTIHLKQIQSAGKEQLCRLWSPLVVGTLRDDKHMESSSGQHKPAITIIFNNTEEADLTSSEILFPIRRTNKSLWAPCLGLQLNDSSTHYSLQCINFKSNCLGNIFNKRRWAIPV